MNRMLAEFADLRQYLCEMGAHGVGSKESNQRVPVPAMKDEEGWHQFCFGTSAPQTEIVSSTASDDGDAHSSSEERRVGNECVSRSRSRWSRYHKKKK